MDGTRCDLAWWIAEKGAALEMTERNEVSEDAAKARAVAMSNSAAGHTFQVRYRVNANGPTEVRWEALRGTLSEITGDARRHP
jgi:hypothetical protein